MKPFPSFLLGLVVGAGLLGGWLVRSGRLTGSQLVGMPPPRAGDPTPPPAPPTVARIPAPPAGTGIPVAPPTTMEPPSVSLPSSPALVPPLEPLALPTPEPASDSTAPAEGGPGLPSHEPRETIAMPPVDLADIDRLRARQLLLPVRGVDVGSLRNTFAQVRGPRVHEALDILAPRGTEVLATDEGPVMQLFHSVRGGITVYQFDPSATYCYYYAHLERYAAGLREGQVLGKGEVIGYVGTSGNAPLDTPHLHFQVIKLGPGKKWWEGTSIDAYPLWAFRPERVPGEPTAARHAGS